VALQVAEQYVEAFSKLAKETNTVLLPSNMSDPASMIAQVERISKDFPGVRYDLFSQGTLSRLHLRTVLHRL
jgi:hypothetical protein